MEKTKILTGVEDKIRNQLDQLLKPKKNTLVINNLPADLKQNKLFLQVNENTELIIIQQVPPERLNLLVIYLLGNYIIIEQEGKAPYTLPKPALIITSICDFYSLPSKGFEKQFEVYNLNYASNKG